MIKTFGEASVSAGEIMKRQGTLDSNLSLASGMGETGEEWGKILESQKTYNPTGYVHLGEVHICL